MSVSRRHPISAPALAAVLLAVTIMVMLPPPIAAQTLTTQYTMIYFAEQADLDRFLRSIGGGGIFGGSADDGNLVRKRIDGIIEQVMDILDMRPQHMRITVFLVRGLGNVEAAYHGSGQLGPAPPAFYDHSSQNITVSVDDVTEGMLAHEIAHAVICHHFRTPPPRKMQEILAQYVDRHLKD